MDIDSKDIQILVWRILNFFMNICCRFVQNHPFVSSALLFSFVVYFLFPKLFLYLLYSSPLLVCTAVFIRFYLHSQCSKTQSDLRDHAISSTKSQPRTADLVLSGDDKSSTQSKTLSHKNVKEKREELESQAVMEEKNRVSSNDDSIGRAVVNEGKSRGITEKDHEKVVSRDASIGENIAALGEASNPSLSSLDGLEARAAKCGGGGGGEAEVENSSSDEEETQRSRNKQPMEWTEDDQQNLMDLGISELERNKAMESLIARRKERKLYKMRTDKFLINLSRNKIEVGPALVARGNPFDVHHNPAERFPGSAPSVLLPTRNPFDLPYDPLEEKPDLLADSFQQEFMPAHPKDMLFCRHESFILGPSFPLESKHNDYNIAGVTRLRRPQDTGDEDRPIDNLLSQNGETLHRTISVTDLVTEGEEGEEVEEAAAAEEVEEAEAEAEEEEEEEEEEAEAEEEKEGKYSNQISNKLEEDGEAYHNVMETKEKMTENTHDMDSSLGIGNNMKTRTNTINRNKNKSSSSPLSGNTKSIIKPDKLEIQPPIFRFPDVMSPSPSSVPCPIPKARSVNELSNAVSPSTIYRSRLENHLLYTDNLPLHTPTHSIASDMQVEFSEIGSPPLTGDGSVSSRDADSLTFDGDIEKDGSEEIWASLPYASTPQEREMTGGFSGFHKDPEDPLASSSRIEIPQEGHTHLINSNHKIFNDVEQAVEAVGEQRPSNAVHAVSQEKSMGGTCSLLEGYTQNPQGPKSVEDGNAGAETSAVGDISKVDEVIYSESSKRSKRNSLNTPELSGKEVNVACSMDEHLSEPDKENIIVASKHIESKPSKSPGMPAEEVNIPYNIDDSLVHIDVTKPEMKPSENRDRIEKCIEQEVLVDLTKQAEERTSEIGKHTENDSDKPPDNQPIIESLMPTAEDNNSNEGKIDQIPSRDVKKEPSAGEVQVSGVNQRLNDPSTSWMQQETTVEQASTVSSFSSPLKSVLPERSPLDQSPSELNRHIRTDVSESDMEEMIVRKSLLDEQATEHVAHSAPHNVHHVTDHPFTESMSEISEETSVSLKKSTDEAREMFNISKAVIGDGDAKEDLKSTNTTHGEPEASINSEDAKELSKTPVENIPEFTVKEEALPQNCTPINDAVVDDVMSKEKLELAADKKADTTEISKAMEDPSSGHSKDTKAESGNMTEDAVGIFHLQPAGEGSTSNEIRNIEDVASREGNDNPKVVEVSKVDPQI
uniref:Cardiomyopathy-associated protein 5 n=1 Tax=Manihot esculenta TaxID=3983 RepID=A0A2C9WFJ3_MANES